MTWRPSHKDNCIFTPAIWKDACFQTFFYTSTTNMKQHGGRSGSLRDTESLITENELSFRLSCSCKDHQTAIWRGKELLLANRTLLCDRIVLLCGAAPSPDAHWPLSGYTNDELKQDKVINTVQESTVRTRGKAKSFHCRCQTDAFCLVHDHELLNNLNSLQFPYLGATPHWATVLLY